MILPDRPNRRGPSRREFVSLGIGAFVVAAAPLLRSGRPVLVRRTVPVMGTIAELGVVHDDARYAHRALDAAVDELVRVERLMTRFRPDSDVGRVNLANVREAVAVTRESAFVIDAALHWAEASDGAFDPCLGGAVTLWDVARRREPPDPVQASHFAGRRLYRALGLDRAAGVAMREEADVSLDLGGIAKGYGVDRAVAALRAWGIRNGLVNVGGDLYALGRSEHGEPWRIGIRSAADPSRLAGTMLMSDRAVATSGDYEQFFEHAGRRYHHLLDPATGEPRHTAAHSLTIAADDCMTADAAATALFGRSHDAAVTLLRAAAPAAELLHLG